jgi:hypothetical protein
LLGICINQTVLCRIFTCDPGGVESGTHANIRLIQRLLIFAGIAIVTRRVWWKRLRESSLVRWLKPGINWKIIFAFLPAAIASIGFQVTGCVREGAPWWSIIVASSILERAVISCLWILLFGMLVVRLLRRPVLLLLIAIPWAIAFPIEGLIAFYGGGRFDPALLGTIASESVTNYTSVGAILTVIVGAGLVFATAGVLLRHIGKLARWPNISRLAVWLAALTVLPPSICYSASLDCPSITIIALA